jgi:hypothetical protein
VKVNGRLIRLRYVNCPFAPIGDVLRGLLVISATLLIPFVLQSIPPADAPDQGGAFADQG